MDQSDAGLKGEPETGVLAGGQKRSAKVQLRQGRVQKCKGERGRAARGHVGTVTRGRGDEQREARRLRGSVDQNRTLAGRLTS